MRRDGWFIDYLRKVPIKVDLSEDTFDPWRYNRENGGLDTEMAERIVRELRSTKQAAGLKDAGAVAADEGKEQG